MPGLRRPAQALLLLAAGALGCGDAKGPPSPYPLDGVLRLNHLQAKGTHNSYHVMPPNPIDPSHRYTQAKLDVQLESQGVRQLELDLHYRRDAGFQVFHIPFLDDHTTCRRFTDCLATVKAWSDAHPWHLPITIWIEPKDLEADVLDSELLPLAGRFEDLEQVILSVIPRERILTPDDVRGVHPDLPTALAVGGWPTLGRLRGRIIFALLDDGVHRDEYTRDGGNLAGRLLFVKSTAPTDFFAAYFKIDDARANAAQVTDLVKAGFIVTSTVDEAGQDAGANQALLEASLPTGFQYGSSDFPVPGTADGGDSFGYSFVLPGGMPARCNPVYPADRCTSADIEALP